MSERKRAENIKSSKDENGSDRVIWIQRVRILHKVELF